MEEVKTTLAELRDLNVFPTNTNADFSNVKLEGSPAITASI